MMYTCYETCFKARLRRNSRSVSIRKHLFALPYKLPLPQDYFQFTRNIFFQTEKIGKSHERNQNFENMFFPLSFWENLGDVYSLSESFPFDYDAMETNSRCDLLANSIDGKLKAPVEYKSVKVRIWICVPDSTSSSWIIQTIFEIFLWKEFEEKNESNPRFPIPHRKTTTRLMNIFITLNATKLIFRWAKFSFREKPLLTTSFKSCTDFLLPRGRSEREVQVAKRQKMKILLSWIWSSHSSSRSRAFNFVLRWIIELLLARRWRAKFMLEQLLGGAKLLSLIATVECFRQFYGVRPASPVPVLEEKIEHLLWISDKQTTQRKRRSSRKSCELLSEPDLFYVLQSWAQPGSLSLLYKVVIYLREMSKLNEICASRREPRPQKSAYRCS